VPKLKRNVKNAPERTGFEPYDGPEPTPGFRRAVIKSAKVVESANGRPGFLVTAELEAKKGSQDAKFDGYPAFTRIWLGTEDSAPEALLAREAAFYRAVTGKKNLADVDVVHEDSDGGGKITKINGVNPVGKAVLVELQYETYNGERRISSDGIYPAKADDVDADETESDEPEEEPDEDEDEDLLESDDEEIEIPSEADLKKMSIADLRSLAEELGVDTDGLKKAQLVEAILADPDEESDEEDEEEEDEAELEDAEEDEEEEEDEDDGLDALDRTQLKALLKAEAADFKVLKRHTDEDLVAALRDVRASEPPF
jgi:hypothetical protein